MAVAAALLLLGVLASKASTRLGVPALLLFLGIGMLAGSDGIGGIRFDDFELAQTVGTVALAFILFAGGLDTRWTTARRVLPRALLLATAGVVITALVVGAFAAWVLDIRLLAGLLLGAIVSSTDAAAVFSVLRTRAVGLRGDLRPLLELESGSNDPMAVFLTVGLLKLLTEPSTSVVDLLPLFVLQMGVGAAVGYALARLAVAVVNRTRLESEGLYPVVLVAVVLLVFGVTAVLGGSGFLAVYVAGIVMGNATFLHKRSLTRFADALAWLMQIAMFLVLGLLVFPSNLGAVAWQALLISAVLVVVARPVACAVVLPLTRLGARDTALVSWVGLRGAVPIVLATFPLVEGVPQAGVVFDVVFFIVLTSVLVQGTTIPLVARRLGVDAPASPEPTPPLEPVDSADAPTALHELTVATDSAIVGRALVDARLPEGALVVLVTRGGDFVVPQGSTVLEAGDVVLLLADDVALAGVRSVIEGR